jgi:hypothetical protein
MGKKLTDTGNSRFEDEQRMKVDEDEEPLVFEGITLAHSPRLGRRLIEWISDRRE